MPASSFVKKCLTRITSTFCIRLIAPNATNPPSAYFITNLRSFLSKVLNLALIFFFNNR